MVKFEFEGREFEFRGRYGRPKVGDYFLSEDSIVVHSTHNFTSLERAIVHPVEKYHDFGGVRFKETGEVRPLKSEEFGVNKESCKVYHGPTLNEYGILEPIEILPK